MQGAIPGIFHFLIEIIMISPPNSLKSNQGHVPPSRKSQLSKSSKS